MNSTSRLPEGFWDFGTGKEDAIHRIHGYPAKFPAFITSKALEYAELKGVSVQTVADIFCGCGTTAVEAKKNGKNFWGWDINPVATLIAEVKTRQYKDAKLEEYFTAIKKEFRVTKVSKKERENVNERIKYWFDAVSIRDLLRLKRSIKAQVPVRSHYRKFFLCAFSNILKPTSKWLTKSIKAQIDPYKEPYCVMEAFEGQFTRMRAANKHNIFPPGDHTVRIVNGNFLSTRIKKCAPDLIVASPPYVVSYDYAEIHQLSSLWLDFVSDYRDLRKNMIGNRYGLSVPSDEQIEGLCPAGKKVYRALLKSDRQKAISVAQYYIDIERAVRKCWSMLTLNGMAVFVIGNTEYKGIQIDNAEYLCECLRKAGFGDPQSMRRKISMKTMTPYRDSKGRFTRDSRKRRIYQEEFVVSGRKEG